MRLEPLTFHSTGALESVSFDRSDGTFGGTGVAIDHPAVPIAQSSGVWSGQFSNRADNAGNPRLTAGAFDTSAAFAAGSQWDLYGEVSPYTNRMNDSPIKVFSASEARHQFGRPNDTARAECMVVEKHGRTVVVLAIETFERPRGWTAAPSEKMDRDER